ncbi:multidrug resistance efflux transporter family protein [Sulfobacillus harzensis]|uniref:Multidrug resistance efflux transporter family protein n=1 Tax=Sulfobacillus harzensis TaxID=2729629 RepID=A0A7Y0L218_9FIRM|nr:multidrug resistance efflux transporter family protein [Sulfobacillus harzensis]NMP21775.1 multidrug resistance efflux transporter family protein [Sulfobacillus harzensis]
MKRALALGALAALFFASTFVINRLMIKTGESALWLASLRYLFTLIPLAGLVFVRGELTPLLKELKHRFTPWLLWGTVGFGLFYLPLTMATRWAPAWLTAGSWQLTIVMGSLLVPFIQPRQPIPVKELWPSLIILFGVAMSEWASHKALGPAGLWALVPVAIAAIAYPLGNRQMMAYVNRLPRPFSVYQRTLGMTIGSLPFWIVSMGVGYARSGWPSGQLLLGALGVALASGVVATLLFFRATDQAQGNINWLARIEATQSLEIVFTVLMASLIFSQAWPTGREAIGLAIIIAGMVIHSLRRSEAQSPAEPTTLSG